jgi:hypothetical protein
MSDEDRTSSNKLASHSNALYSPWVRSLLERLPPFVVALNMINHPQEEAFKREVCNSYVIDEFEQWIGGRDKERPFHAFFNLVDAHEPYPIIENGTRTGALARWYGRTPRYYLLAVPGLQALVPWKQLLAGYIWSIEKADEKVGRILRILEATGERERTMVIVTSDHGQSFGEAGNVFHGCGATDSITRIPLVVSPPTQFSVPAKIDDWVSLTSIDSWVRATASGLAPFEEDGRAPLPFSASASPADWIYCEGAPASDPNHSLRGIRPEATWNRRLVAAYRGQEKYIVDVATGDVLRWNTSTDPDPRAGESFTGRDAAQVRADVFGEYDTKNALVSAIESNAPETAVDRRLKSWGYD